LFFYRKKSIDEIKNLISEIRFTPKIFELLREDMKDAIKMMAWILYTEAYPLVVVINPKYSIKQSLFKI